MRSPFLYAKNLLRYGWFKLRFGRGLHMGLIQTYDRLKMEIYHGGKITIGNFGQNRGETYYVTDGGRITVGDHSMYGMNCFISSLESIEIGDYARIGQNCVIMDHDHDFRKNMESAYKITPIKIGNHVWVGANCTILRGANIGDHVVIAAGSVVRGDIPANSVYVQKRTTEIIPYEIQGQ